MFAFYRARPNSNQTELATTTPSLPLLYLPQRGEREREHVSLYIDTTSKQAAEAAGIAPTTCHATNSIILDTGLNVHTRHFSRFLLSPPPCVSLVLLHGEYTRSAVKPISSMYHGLNHPRPPLELEGWTQVWETDIDSCRRVYRIKWFLILLT